MVDVKLKVVQVKDVQRLTEAFRLVAGGLVKSALQLVDLLVVLVVLAAIIMAPHYTLAAATSLTALLIRMIIFVVRLMMALFFVGLIIGIIGWLIRKSLLEAKK
jgi:hypothetical protein